MKTLRTCLDAPGRLFPPITWDHGWSLSLQADKFGYQCSPNERFETLEEYETVEAVLHGPFPHVVDLTTMDLPPEVLAKFEVYHESSSAIGCNLTWEDVDAVKLAVLRASLNPNAGIPRGSIGWYGRKVYHGTSNDFAEDIAAHGISMAKSSGGYFGQAFYVADEKELAVSNYAEFSGDEDGGAVLEFAITEGARILDLRNSEDAAEWQNSGLVNRLGSPDLDVRARKLGIDGVYDRSVGGLAIYNPAVLGEPIRIHRADAKEGLTSPRP